MITPVKFNTVAKVLATYPDFSVFGAQKFVPKCEFPVTAKNFQQYRSYCEFSQDYFFNLWQDFDAKNSRDVRVVKAGKSISDTIVSTHRGDITLDDYIADCQKLWAKHQATFIQLANEYHEAKQAEEVAQIQEAAELEEAELENETETVALPENITFVKTPTRTETLAKEIFNDTLAQNPLIQQDFGQSPCTQIIAVCADSTFAGLGISAQNACDLPQAETAPAETIGNPETPQIDPYLAERPIDETITANEFYSYPDPETLTNAQINDLFAYSTTPKNDIEFWDISVGKTLYKFAFYDSGEYSLWLENIESGKRKELIAWDSLKPDFTLTHAQIMRDAYALIYKDLCQISPFAPRETIINLESDKGLSDVQVREVEKSLLIGINTAENFIIYNARAEYDTKAGRWLCIGKDPETSKRIVGYIDACKVVAPYKQAL